MEKDVLNDFIKTGHGMARFLREHGVQFVFGVPDGHTLGFYDGILATEGIKHVLFNDERSAAFAADAYARVTGMLGVCDAGAAGAMNFPIALSEAKGSASPVLAIVGVVKSHDMLKNIPHDINVAEALAPVTKWTGKVLDTVNLPRFMTYAIKQAINGKPGPVALVIAENVISSSELKLKEFVPRVAGSCSLNSCRSVPAAGEIDKAIKMIRASKQPALFVGDGALISEAYAEVAELSRILKAPVFSTISGKGIMIQKNGEDNLYFGTIGLFGESPNHKFVRNNIDLLIVVGNRLTEDDTANFKIPPQNLEMIQIDIDPAEIGLSYNPLGVVGDPKSALVEIISGLKSSIVENLESETEIIKQRTENLKALRLSHRIDKLIGLDSVIKEAINCDGFNVVDVVIDRNELLPPIHY